MHDRLNSLLERHCETIKASVNRLGDMLAPVATGSSAAPLTDIQTAEALAHQLKGSSGTAGFHELSRAATELDDCLKTLCQADTEQLTAGIDEAMARFQRLEKTASETTPASSSLYQAA